MEFVIPKRLDIQGLITMKEIENYWQELVQMTEAKSFDYKALYHLLEESMFDLTQNVHLVFATSYMRMSYVFHQYQIPKKHQWVLMKLKKLTENENILNSAIEEDSNKKSEWQEILYSFGKYLSQVSHTEMPESILQPKISDKTTISTSLNKYYPHLRVTVQEIDTVRKQLICSNEAFPGELLRVSISDAYSKYDTDDIFTQERYKLTPPFTLSLLNANVSEGQIVETDLYILEPDYLIDVTTVSEISADQDKLEYLLLTKKFLNQGTTPKLLEGHAANLFLDNLIRNPNCQFKDVFSLLLKIYPLVLAKYTDSELKDLYNECMHHFSTLQWILKNEFPKQNINTDEIFLEPSFISPIFGIQGRLDIYFKGKEGKQAIVELKSGKPFKANKYGLSASHYYQTLLYDLLVKSTNKEKVNPSCFILYSKLGEQGMRYAPPVKSMQYESLMIRNRIYQMERNLCETDFLPYMIEKLKVTDTELNGFVRDNWILFKNVILNAEAVCQDYFYECVSFISREHQIAKKGSDKSYQTAGQASVWLQSTSKKEENFALLKNLVIREVLLNEEEPIVILYKSDTTNVLANFRVGDIVILYPGTSQSPAENQIFKSSIIEITEERIVIRLRSTQLNAKVFFDHDVWNIEPDLLDSSFNGLYRNLFDFLKSPDKQRQIILGVVANESTGINSEAPDYLLESQKAIFQAAINASSYYLIWGPPGTGKTSQLLKALASYYFNNLSKPILIAAYTNRAVDEICEALDSIDANIRSYYLRIGSKYGTHPNYRDCLLDNKIKDCTQRAQILEILKRQRIVVGTLASINGKSELFDYYDFECGIVDEASQVLEPMMAGIMSKLKKTILIGDHIQMPSIVCQDEQSSLIKNENLQKIGFINLSESLFERLLRRCQKMNWENSYGMLNYQGRMHEEIVEFPNMHFYNGYLKNIFKNEPNNLFEKMQSVANESIYFQKRCSFLDCSPSADEIHLKTSINEANHVVEMVRQIAEINAKTGIQPSIGIITPFRAQIALIKQVLENEKLLNPQISIDTVERYQGSARDIIIISLVANRKSSLRSITSFNNDGIDRKLNVALTRAKSQIFIVGNKNVLNTNPLYQKLISTFEINPIP